MEYASWRWIFFVNLPIGVAGIIFSVLKLHEHKEGAAGRFDAAGFVLAGAGLALVLLGLSEGPVRGWGDPLVGAVLSLGLVLIAVLVVVELRKREPMLDLRLLGERSFRTPNVVSFATTAALIGLLFLLPQFLQGPRGLDPFQSGLTTFPQAFGVIAVSRLVGVRLYPVIGPRRLVLGGAVVMSLLTAMFLRVDVETSQWWIRLLMFGRGMAMGFVFIPVQAAAFARIRTQDTGRASALYQAQRQVGAAVGVAFLATVLVERGQALLAGATNPAEQAAALTTAFHDAVIASVILCAIAAVAAVFLRDDDAAPTMRPREMWTFNNQYPGPTLRGKVGDLFTVTLRNDGKLGHSIDFHASRVAWNDEMRTIQPGESLVHQFTAEHAGIYMYHCGTAPALHHIGNGMFGAIIIDPPDLAPVDHEFVFVQSELYLGPEGQAGDLTKMQQDAWDAVVFNGYHNQYAHAPVRVEPGERVRAWVLDAGPSENSSFHVVGTIFDTVYAEGRYLLQPAAGRGGSQALALQPAQGGFVEFSLPEEGFYPIVTHKFSNVGKGALGLFQAGDAELASGEGH